MLDAPVPTLTFSSPVILAGALALALAATGVSLFRRIALPRGAAMLLLLGLGCLCLGAGQLTWLRRDVGRVAVVVDVSPSTLTATFRDHRELQKRLDQLFGRAGYTLYHLAEGVSRAQSQSLEHLPFQFDCRQTRYAPPPEADAVVLFSDGRFAPPSPVGAPPTYVVLDPALDHPQDGAIERLELRGDIVAATVFSSAGERRISLGGTDVKDVTVAEGRFVVTGKVASDAGVVDAFLSNSRDRWSANDALRMRLPPRRTAQKWWVGSRPPPSSQWVHLQPRDVPADLADFLAAGVVALDNVPVDALAEQQRWRLHQYVRELGGGIIILGGENAFAAGGYSGSSLEHLSPLASTPPKPAAQWLILADSSGSMARTLGDNSRWHFAVNAIGQIVPLLPADDTISVGGFSQAVRWWIAGQSVREAQASFASPKDLRPHGPTNLAAALRLVADTVDGALPTQLLIITDGEAKIDDAEALAGALAGKDVRVSILAAEKVPDNHPLRRITDRTGGRLISQDDPRRWAALLKRLMRAASPPWLQRQPMTIRPTDAAPSFDPQEVAVWNRTWLKRDATELAIGVTNAGEEGEGRVPAIAAWNVGSGAVISAAFAAPPALAELLADRVATPPRDPRFRLSHDAARELRITLEAFDERGGGDGGGYMNGLSPRVELSPEATAATETIGMAQTAPGRYEASMPAPDSAAFVTVRLNGRVIDRFAVAGRYPAEYDRIGNDRAALESLARSTGGALIEPSHTSPLDLRRRTRTIPLAPYLAAAGAALIGAGLVTWRRR